MLQIFKERIYINKNLNKHFTIHLTNIKLLFDCMNQKF